MPTNIVVGSGKGGVGKSTVCVNLAIALAAQGLQVGLMDADIYGPSIPAMMGLRRLSPRTILANNKEVVLPFQKYGVKVMSIGFFQEEADASLWRGPILHTALQKMVESVDWGDLDLLLIDLPPGTGDVPLSLSKLLTIDGAIVVTTPQLIASLDVIKAINAFHQLKIPLLGIVENMCGEPFGQGMARQLAERFETSVITEIPLHPHICRGGDEGVPVALQKQGIGQLFHSLQVEPWQTSIQQ